MDFITRAITAADNNNGGSKKCPSSPPPPSYATTAAGGASDGYNPEATAYYPKNSPCKKKAATNAPPTYHHHNTPPSPPPFYCNPSAFLGGYINCGMSSMKKKSGTSSSADATAMAMNAPSPAQPMGGFRSSVSVASPACSSLPPRSSSSTTAAHSLMFDYILVCDFEATCQENNFCFPNEIIEFPVVAIHLPSNKIIGEFHSFVKPKKFGGKLTPFCTELTGITQEQVESAPGLETVIKKFNRWLAATIPSEDSRIIFATDGPTDMENFMYKHSVLRDGIDFPRIFYNYVDVRRSFSSLFGTRPSGPKMMLSHLGLEFEGRLHSGLDDTRNIARIVKEMNSQGYFLKQNMVCFEAFSVCEIPPHRRLTGPSSYPPAVVEACRRSSEPENFDKPSTTCTPASNTEKPCAGEEKLQPLSGNEPEFPPVDEDTTADKEEEEPFILPGAAVDIVSPKRVSVPSSPEPKKKFATHMRHKAKQQGISCVTAGKKLSVRNVSKLPIAETLEQQQLISVIPEAMANKEEEKEVQVVFGDDSTTVATQSPGLTSNSSRALSSLAPSSSPLSTDAAPKRRRRVHKKKTIRATPL